MGIFEAGILGTLVARKVIYGSKRAPLHSRMAHNYAPQYDWRHVPANLSGSLRRRSSAHRGGIVPRVDCCIWKYADLLYQRFPQSERDMWRHATKRPHMSPYDLWMHEAIPYLNEGLSPPDQPSHHGGYSTDTDSPGTREPATMCYILKYIRRVSMLFRYQAGPLKHFYITVEFWPDRCQPEGNWTFKAYAWDTYPTLAFPHDLDDATDPFTYGVNALETVGPTWLFFVFHLDTVMEIGFFSTYHPWTFQYPYAPA